MPNSCRQKWTAEIFAILEREHLSIQNRIKSESVMQKWES